MQSLQSFLNKSVQKNPTRLFASTEAARADLSTTLSEIAWRRVYYQTRTTSVVHRVVIII